MKKTDSSKAVTMMQQSIKVFNADGTLKKDYGVVSFWHRNPLKRFAWRLKQFYKRITEK